MENGPWLKITNKKKDIPNKLPTKSMTSGRSILLFSENLIE